MNARHEIVPFHGRADVLGDLRGWCEGDGVTGCRLIHGPGGMGKTRLLIELCRQMQERDWRAGFVPKRLDPARVAELVASEKPTLAVVDYAESRSSLRELLAPVLRRRDQGGRGRLRVLLLARTKGDWWEAALRSDVADLLRDEEPKALSPLVPEGEERASVFREAAKRFAEQRGTAVAQGPAPDLGDPRYDRVLYVHMAALATVDGRTFTAKTLMEDTLNHEEEFWARKFGPKPDLDDRLLREKLRRIVAALTLRGGAADRAEANALVERVGEGRDDALALLLHDLYPSGEAGGARYLAGLEPDLLGEAMVYRALRAEGTAVGTVLERVFEGGGARSIRNGFEVLGRLSEEHEEAVGWVAQVLACDVPGRAMEAFAATRTVGERTAHSALGMQLAKALEREGTLELAKRLEEDLPEPGESVSLLEVGRWVMEMRLKHLPDSTEPDVLAERARLFSNLGSWQSDLRQAEEAIGSALKAVEICLRLVNAQPDAFEPNLASTLNNLSLRAADVGRWQLSLDAANAAVALYRQLSERRPNGFRSFLAMSLNNLGSAQSELGQHNEALASTREAVDLYRLLSQQGSEFLPALAKALTNLGIRLGEQKQRKEALASTQEAVAIYRRLAEANPDAFLADLAAALNNLSVDQAAMEDAGRALTSAHEAVAIRRRLAQLRPHAFQADLATSLHNLGLWQNAFEQREAAVASAYEALDAIWPSFERLPAAFERLTDGIIRNLREYLEARDQPPSSGLLQRIETFEARRGR